MGISFKFLQCKRAEPPEVESIECAVALKGSTSWSTYSEPIGDVFTGYAGAIVPHDTHIDPLTHKQFKVPQPNEKDIGDMFKFYGIDLEKTYQCPACDLKGSLRTLLPHLNNTDSGFIETVYPTPKPTPEIDKPIVKGSVDGAIAIPSGETTFPYGDSFVGEIHESHGWNFKQLGEWMKTLGY